jgi:ubiquinone/menaquinone biosynthesis C-methylase UbiE
LNRRHYATTVRHPWVFDEFTHAGVDFSDPRQVEEYDRKQRSDPEKEAVLLRRLGLAGDHVLVEIGPGTGALTIEAAKLCRRVYAVDVSSAMLSFIRTKAQRAGVTNIEYANAGFLSYEHTGDAADFVVTKNALHHLPDYWKVEALRRIWAMLKPDGTFFLRDAVFSFPPEESEARLEAWIDEVSSETGEGWTRSEFEAHVRQEYSTYTWLLESMVRRAGFEIIDADYDPLEVYAEYTCVKRQRRDEVVSDSRVRPRAHEECDTGVRRTGPAGDAASDSEGR